ncbi:hypothetical protein AB0M20_05410 [Actinoplanes sp. NPDC051633]|uniref:hypothetical protein n=1 Tax=Actinoplanes sp. NPDC051633 TaxID=3155670 RepID=UPI00343816D8
MGKERLGEQQTADPADRLAAEPAPPARSTAGVGGNAMWSSFAGNAAGLNPALWPGLLAHAGNAAIARAVEAGGGAQTTDPAALPPGQYQVVVVGSPSPGELPGPAYQDAAAGARAGGEQRVWLVERTGYELAKVDLGEVEARAKGAPVFWVTPDSSLPSLLGKFPPGSIAGLHVFSHGVPGALTLRYNWPDHEDYGLSLAGARTLTPQAFAANADITFDSCNSGTDPSLLPGLDYGERSLAAEVADATERPVTAWSGRTSYRQVNRGTGGVMGSEVFGGGWRPDFTEVYSGTVRQRVPTEFVTPPSRSAGDWSSWFKMKARLPETRRFPVKDKGSVTATIAASSEFEPMQGAQITVILHRDVSWGRDDDLTGSPAAVVGQETATTWSDLEEGTYYIELYHLSGLEVEGTISVTVR